MTQPFYLLDTNICIFYLRGKYDIDQQIDKVGWENCCISEITMLELKMGVELSLQHDGIDRSPQLNQFLNPNIRSYIIHIKCKCLNMKS